MEVPSPAFIDACRQFVGRRRHRDAAALAQLAAGLKTGKSAIALLVDLRRVDAPKSHALVAELDGVAVGDGLFWQAIGPQGESQCVD